MRSRSRRGNVLILFAIFLTALVGMVAFAIDVGYIALVKGKLQSTADAGALAGAGEMMTLPGQAVDEAAVRAEVKTFVTHNMPGLTVLEDDIKLCRYNPFNQPNSRLSYAYDLNSSPPNAVQVTVRRDSLANDPLSLFFAPVIGHRQASVAATATAYIMKAGGIAANAPLLPYTMHVDYYEAAKSGQEYIGIDGQVIPTADEYTVDKDTFNVSKTPDGVREVMLFASNNAPGNFGTIDIGSSQNSTPELERQVYDGPTEGDFSNSDFASKVTLEGDGTPSLYVPFATTGDTGLSTAVKTALTDIIGQPRIIPLYGPDLGPDGVKGGGNDIDGPAGTDGVIDGVFGEGNNAVYNIVRYAGIVITKVEFRGNQKMIWVQTAFVASNKVTPYSGNGPVADGVYTTPKLVIP